ncbi:MAG TPA: hypothetical protein VNA11_01975 [Pseudonocardia sp.]|nr:hypothetical protein [Pseudonocardia sp.]
MVAVPEVCASAPIAGAGAGRLSLLTHCHRAVAVVDTAVELLRPESDLLRILAGIGEIDVLVAADEVLPAAPGPVGVLNPGLGDPTGRHLAVSEVDEVEEADEDALRAEEAAEIERLGLPGLRVHHLRLRPPIGPLAEADLVAALSELVGFDPEPGVYCLAPAPAPTDLGRTVLTSAARRIAQVYGLPLLRYRCLELAVVPGQRTAAGC